MVEGQRVEIVASKGRRAIPGVIRRVVNEHTADVVVKLNDPEQFEVIGAVLVEQYPDVGQFTLAEDDEAAEMRALEEAEAREQAEAGRIAAQANNDPPQPTPETQDIPRDENNNVITPESVIADDAEPNPPPDGDIEE